MENKWTLLYEYSKNLFDMEVERFKRLDDKANNQLRFTYILITIYLAMIKIIFIDTHNELSTVIFVLILLSFIFLFSAWLNYFLSLKLTIVPRLPLTQEVFDLFNDDDNDFDTIQFALHQIIKNAVDEYIDIISKKAKTLRYGYNSTILSIICIILSISFISYNYYINLQKTNIKKEAQMAKGNTDKNGSNEKQAVSKKPNFNVKIPNLTYATEGYEIDLSKHPKLKDLSDNNKTDK